MRLTTKQRRAGEERLRDPDASEKAIMLRAGYAPSTSRVPSVKIPGGTQAAAALVLAEQPKSMTPAQARVLALSELQRFATNEEARDDVRVVALKQLLDYGLNAPDLEPEVTGRDARAWRRAMHRASRMRSFELALRLGFEKVEAIVAANRLANAIREDATAAGAVIDVTPLDVVAKAPTTKRENKGQSGNVR